MTGPQRLPLPPERSSPRQARLWLRPLIVDRVPDAEGLLLCVSEVVANAVLHAGTRCELSIEWRDDAVRISVRDFAPDRLPVKRNFDRDATTGRGLHILDSCSTQWGIEQEPASKVVWFELPSQDELGARR